MNLRLAIEAAIRHTLVVENKQSIGYAVEKILSLLPNSSTEADKITNNPLLGEQVKEWILCAAILVEDGEEHLHQPRNIKTGFVICGRRHHNCYRILELTN
jgi:hypothetical protein